jgi:hypothetical protein
MKNEPVLTAASVSAAIVAIASIFNIGLDLGTVQTIVVAVLPLLLALVARTKVTPI